MGLPAFTSGDGPTFKAMRPRHEGYGDSDRYLYMRVSINGGTPKSSKSAYYKWENQWFGLPIFPETSIIMNICE